ncbi:MAG: hypothetical protein ACRDRF_08825, partial [Pseudonocardiaceae bacterium]
MSQRDIDVVVFGATSLTGRHVAAYLAQRASELGACAGLLRCAAGAGRGQWWWLGGGGVASAVAGLAAAGTAVAPSVAGRDRVL